MMKLSTALVVFGLSVPLLSLTGYAEVTLVPLPSPFAKLGGPGNVSCNYSPPNEPYNFIRWYHPNKTTLVYVYKNLGNASGDLAARASHFHTESTITLEINDVNTTDEGSYICEFAGGTTGYNSTELRISREGNFTADDENNIRQNTTIQRDPLGNGNKTLIKSESHFRCAKPAFNLTLFLLEGNDREIQDRQNSSTSACTERGEYFGSVQAEATGGSNKNVCVEVRIEHIISSEMKRFIVKCVGAVCPANCEECGNDAICRRCASGFTRNGDGCVKETVCPANCEECGNDAICRRCASGFIDINGGCVNIQVLVGVGAIVGTRVAVSRVLLLCYLIRKMTENKEQKKSYSNEKAILRLCSWLLQARARQAIMKSQPMKRSKRAAKDSIF